jgi:hypothetical protein
MHVHVRIRRRRAVGAFDDTLARIDGAFCIVIWFSSAAGMRMSTSSEKSCSLVIGSASGKPATVLCVRT